MLKIRPVLVSTLLILATLPASALPRGSTSTQPRATTPPLPVEPPIIQFFKNFEGHWAGEGVFTQYDANDVPTLSAYDVLLDVAQQGGAWQATITTIPRNGTASHRAVTVFYITDRQFLVGSPGHLDPADLVDVDGHDIVYRLQGRDPVTGRILTQGYRLFMSDRLGSSLDPSPVRELHSHDTSVLNGQIVVEDEFDVKRIGLEAPSASSSSPTPHPSAAPRSR